jgi:hypothetical protein
MFNLITGNVIKECVVAEGSLDSVTVSGQWLAAIVYGDERTCTQEEVDADQMDKEIKQNTPQILRDVSSALRASRSEDSLLSRMAEFCRPKKNDIKLYVWAWREKDNFQRVLCFGERRSDEPACAVVDGDSIYYSVGPEREVLCEDISSGRNLWICEVLACRDPPTANRIEKLIAHDAFLLAQHENNWSDFCEVSVIDTSSGVLLNCISSFTSSLGILAWAS